MTARVPRGRALLVALSALVLALVALPTARGITSGAIFTATTTSSSNTVSGGSCATTTTWSTLVSGLLTSGARESWQRLGTSTSTLPNDNYQTSDAWTQSGLTANRSGALYCDSDTAVTVDADSDTAASVAKSYATWGATGTLTVALWVRGTATTAGRLWTLAEGSSGGNVYSERALWATASGGLVLGGRYGSPSGSSWSIATSGITVNDGHWHLVVATMSAVDGTAALYVDGAAATISTTGTISFGRATGSSSTTAAWYLGANAAGRGPAGIPTAGWYGDYDEFVVLSGTLTTAQLGTGAGSLHRAADS